ncbi:DUF1449 domain-containing protein [Vibrio sp. WXL103]|uniref:DUF1449 domain-containing protein n=1 Tax=unclassified Vibrio TaxID=2614977 RepID=UPI003EC8A95C
MELAIFWERLLSFPVMFFSVPFCILFLVMLIDMIFDFLGSAIGELDFLDFDPNTGGSFLLPKVLTKVPLAVALTVTFFIGTIISFYASHFLIDLPTVFQYSLGSLLILVTLYLSLLLADIALRPLAPLFCNKNSFAQVEFVGLSARVMSANLDKDRGEIVVLHQGNEFLLDAYCQSENPLAYGDEVVILSLDTTSQRYEVVKV